jgi:Outer membrane protein and related peptidoglycan-associated (lipo)proteins
MKKSVAIIFLALCCFTVDAQFLKRVKDEVKQRAENRGVDKAGQATDSVLDAAEEDLRGNNKENQEEEPEADVKPKAAEKKAGDNSVKAADTSVDEVKPQNTFAAFKNYDFVPGDKIIFYYDMEGEQDSEIPGRMLVNSGDVEVQSLEGQKVLFIPKNANLSMKPQMKNDSYLPEQFTLEFDVMANGDSYMGSSIDLYFRAREDSRETWSGKSKYYIRLEGLSDKGSIDFSMEQGDDIVGGYRQMPEEAVNEKQNNWRRVAIYVNKNIGKVYLDQHRVAIVNQIEAGAGMVTFEFRNDYHPIFIKNIRIAAGGADAYKKVITDGKFIAYGIQFDVNKATLKPESMGTLNEIAKMLKAHADLKFEIGGHTDSDGADEPNLKLSQQRAESVKNQLVALGVDGTRLTTKGFGETQPIADNDSSEGKAKNRRVEFVKR